MSVYWSSSCMPISFSSLPVRIQDRIFTGCFLRCLGGSYDRRDLAINPLPMMSAEMLRLTLIATILGRRLLLTYLSAGTLLSVSSSPATCLLLLHLYTTFHCQRQYVLGLMPLCKRARHGALAPMAMVGSWDHGVWSGSRVVAWIYVSLTMLHQI